MSEWLDKPPIDGGCYFAYDEFRKIVVVHMFKSIYGDLLCYDLFDGNYTNIKNYKYWWSEPIKFPSLPKEVSK